MENQKANLRRADAHLFTVNMESQALSKIMMITHNEQLSTEVEMTMKSVEMVTVEMEMKRKRKMMNTKMSQRVYWPLLTLQI